MRNSLHGFKSASIGLTLLLSCSVGSAATITKTYAFSPGDVISSSQMNADFDQLFTEINARETRISTLESNSMHWDGSSTGLNATTARASLGLGSAAVMSATAMIANSGTTAQAASFNVSGTGAVGGNFSVGGSITSATPIMAKFLQTVIIAGTGDYVWDTMQFNTDLTSFALASGNTAVTFLKAGYYEVMASVLVSGLSSGQRATVELDQNTIARSDSLCYGGSDGYCKTDLITSIYANANDYVHLTLSGGGNRFGISTPWTQIIVRRLN